MRKIFVCLPAILLCFVQDVVCQIREVDSLKHELETASSDTLRVLLLDQLSFAVEYSDPGQSMLYALEGLTLAQKINYREGEAKCLNDIGSVFMDMGKYPEALKYFLQSLRIKEELKDEHGIAVVSANIGSVYEETGEHKKALEYMFKAKATDELLRDSIGILIDLLNIGTAYGKRYFTDSVQQYLDTGMFYLMQANNIALAINDKDYRGAVLSAIGSIYFREGNYSEAMSFFRESEPLAIAISDHEVLAGNYSYMSKIFQQAKQGDSAVYYARASLQRAENSKALTRLKEAAITLTDLFDSQHKTDSAYYYFRQAMAYNDSLYHREKVKEVQTLALEEDERQAELVRLSEEAERKRRKNLQLIGITVFIVTLFIGAVVLSRIKIKPRVVEAMGLFALLLFFEFLHVLLEPLIGRVTHHNPVFKLGILVALVSVVVPLHEWLKDFVKEKLARTKAHS